MRSGRTAPDLRFRPRLSPDGPPPPTTPPRVTTLASPCLAAGSGLGLLLGRWPIGLGGHGPDEARPGPRPWRGLTRPTAPRPRRRPTLPDLRGRAPGLSALRDRGRSHREGERRGRPVLNNLAVACPSAQVGEGIPDRWLWFTAPISCPTSTSSSGSSAKRTGPISCSASGRTNRL